jgi:hypothetical protein
LLINFQERRTEKFSFSVLKIAHHSRWHFREQKLLAFLLAFALLICNTAAGLASRLAGGLALAASAVLCALAKVLGFNSFNMLHNKPP